MFPEPNNELPLIVLILVPETKVGCTVLKLVIGVIVLVPIVIVPLEILYLLIQNLLM